MGLAVLAASMQGVARAADAPVAPTPAPAATPAPPGFGVEPFRNLRRARALDHMTYGLPAFIADRLANTPLVRFESLPEVFPRLQPAAARYMVAGSFERRADWKLAVQVEVRAAISPADPMGAVLASATRIGGVDEAPTLALAAVLEAFAAVPAIKLDPAAMDPAVTARFGRDPYAFVLFGRGLASWYGAGPPTVRNERARQQLMRSLVIDPKVPETRRFLAEVSLSSGKPGHARAALASALELRPDYPAALRALAAIDRAAGLPSAREAYARVVALDPFDMGARRALGELLNEAGQLVEAQRQLEIVLAAAPEDLQARRSLVLVLAARQAGKELVAALEEVVRLDSDNVDARMDLGAAYMAVGRNVEAATTYEDILRRRPRHTGALKLAADLARDRGDIAQASALYTKLRVLAPTDPRPLFLLASAHADAGNLDLAERFFTAGLAFPSVRADALGNLGALALRRGDLKQALSLLDRAAKLRPERALIRFNHAMALHRVGRHVEALGELQTAETLDPTDASVRFFAGVVALRLGLLDEAANSFKDTLALQPGNEDARHNLNLLAAMGLGREGALSFRTADGAGTLLIDRHAAP
jgi:tetratricopeptide (TPR) repeat protein